uniref:SCP domain-containing protein n=1 Tax=Caenorhabditis tropicalis TaxID=1561998 RepID=A0A1I7TDQ9_9PELO
MQIPAQLDIQKDLDTERICIGHGLLELSLLWIHMLISLTKNKNNSFFQGTAASAAWEKEFQDYGLNSINMDVALFNSGVGHATQMIWANTNLIGCGVKNCGRDSTMMNMNKISVVCQYKKPGNVMGQPIYQKGETCSSCPASSKCDASSGLCVS